MGCCSSDQQPPQQKEGDKPDKKPEKDGEKDKDHKPETPKKEPPKEHKEEHKPEEHKPVESHESPRKTLEESTAETDALWKKYRGEADEHATKMREYFEAAHKEGDGAKRKALSEQGKKEQELMKESQKKAATAIFKAKNKDQPKGTIDLHGLHVDEALEIVEDQLKDARHHKLPALRIVVGAGHHSDGGARIKPKVKEYLNEHQQKQGFTWKEDADNESGGSLTVTFN